MDDALDSIQSKQKLPKANITPKNITQKNYHKIKVVLAIGLLFIAGPCFLYVLLLSWTVMLFPVLWWMHTRPGAEYVCDGCWLDHSTAICPAL